MGEIIWYNILPLEGSNPVHAKIIDDQHDSIYLLGKQLMKGLGPIEIMELVFFESCSKPCAAPKIGKRLLEFENFDSL